MEKIATEILPVDDNVCDEMKELRNKHIYTLFKKLDERPYPHSVIDKQGLLLSFYHAWLDTEFVSEKSKQREYLAKLGIDRLDEKWLQSHIVNYENKKGTTMFTDAVIDFKNKLVTHGKYKKLADFINKRDYEEGCNLSIYNDEDIYDGCIWCNGDSLNEEICNECLTRD